MDQTWFQTEYVGPNGPDMAQSDWKWTKIPMVTIFPQHISEHEVEMQHDGPDWYQTDHMVPNGPCGPKCMRYGSKWTVIGKQAYTDFIFPEYRNDGPDMVPNGPYGPKRTIWSKMDKIWVQSNDQYH